MMRLLASMLVLAVGCAGGPETRKDSQVVAADAAQARLDADRALAATLRSITARARKGESSKMREEFLEQAKQRPNDWKPRLLAAWTTQPSEEAWQDVAKICKLSPEEPWPWTASGAIYAQWRNFLDQADADFGRALKVRPGFVPALTGRADVLRLRGRLPEAKAAYEEVLALAPDWQEALVGLGLTLGAQGDTDGARARLDKALKIDPEDLPAVKELARLALLAKDMPKAIELYQKMLQYNPKDREAHLALAKMKAESGDLAGAAAEYEAVMGIGPDLPTAQALVDAYRALKKHDEEARALEKVAQLDPASPAPFLRIAEIRKGDNDSEGAETAMRQAAERAPADPAIHLGLARVVAAKEDLVASIEAYRTAKAKGAADAEAELGALEAKAGLGKQIVGDPNRVYAEVFARLNKRFQELQKDSPALGGKLRARVTIGAEGLASQVEMLEDTVHEPSLAALVYFSLKDAKYPKKSTPTFEFVLNPATKKK